MYTITILLNQEDITNALRLAIIPIVHILKIEYLKIEYNYMPYYSKTNKPFL